MVTLCSRLNVRRGDYIEFTGTLRIIDYRDPTYLTTRHAHGNRVLEWLHARYEDWLLWPVADLKKATLRVRI